MAKKTCEEQATRLTENQGLYLFPDLVQRLGEVGDLWLWSTKP